MSAKLNLLVLGADGYLGWPIACELIARGHMVMGIDNCAKREHYGLLGRSYGVGDSSAIPISSFDDRRTAMSSYQRIWKADICENSVVADAIGAFSPDAIVYLAEQPSRSFAMNTPDGATFTYQNNVHGLLQTIGAIIERKFATLLVRVSAVAVADGVHDFCTAAMVTGNEIVKIACETWNLRSVEFLCGVVYGARTPATTDAVDRTRFDYDSCFGNVVHRFCAQVVVGVPITIYGDGRQRVAVSNLRNVVDCVASVFDRAPLPRGALERYSIPYDVVTVSKIAETIATITRARGLKPQISYISNPRGDESWRKQPMPEYPTAPSRQIPTAFGDDVIEEIVDDLLEHRRHVNRSLLRIRDLWQKRTF